MGGELLRVVRKTEDKRARGRGVDPCRSDRASLGVHRRRGRDEAPVLEGAAARGLRCAEGGGAAKLVEAAEPVLAIDAAEVGMADRRGVGDQALLEPRP